MLTLYHSRKYQLNENFFSSWSPTMAYVLGFWFADGYMKHIKSYRVIFTSADLEHLRAINKAMQSNCPIVKYRRRGTLENCSTFTVHSKKLFSDLQNLGGFRKKSLTIEFPNIPDSLLADFIRGYFEGDGSVFFTSYYRTKDHKKQTEFRCNFTSGSPTFLNSLRDILTKYLSVFPRKVCQYGTNQWKLGYGTKDTERLLKYIYYPGCQLYLERKYLIYQRYLKLKSLPII